VADARHLNRAPQPTAQTTSSMHNTSKSYTHIGDERYERSEGTPWYWRLIALAASWMILGG
jgi:hypothetical protein